CDEVSLEELRAGRDLWRVIGSISAPEHFDDRAPTCRTGAALDLECSVRCEALSKLGELATVACMRVAGDSVPDALASMPFQEIHRHHAVTDSALGFGAGR